MAPLCNCVNVTGRLSNLVSSLLTAADKVSTDFFHEPCRTTRSHAIYSQLHPHSTSLSCDYHKHPLCHLNNLRISLLHLKYIFLTPTCRRYRYCLHQTTSPITSHLSQLLAYPLTSILLYLQIILFSEGF